VLFQTLENILHAPQFLIFPSNNRLLLNTKPHINFVIDLLNRTDFNFVIIYNLFMLLFQMVAKPITTEFVALTEKKMDMTLGFLFF
jgi:hypothetical protein